MKRIHFTLFFIFVVSQIESVFSQNPEKDTLFLLKDLKEGSKQSIFIDKNPKSIYYKELSNFTFNESISYQFSLDYLKDSNQILIKQSPIIPFQNWVPLKKYRGNYYVYKPCDFYTNLSFSFNDSTFIDFTGEGPIANKITEQKKLVTTYRHG